MKRVRSLWLAVFLLICLTTFVHAELLNYYGTATITSPANLGVIDLAFTLDVNSGSIQHDTSYILLDKTLLFPVVLPKLLFVNNIPVISNGVPTTCTIEANCVGVGPRVKSGSNLSSTAFSLTTDDFISTVSGRTVTRKVALVSAPTGVSSNGASLTGTYTETITGLTPQPVVVTGTFFLVRPTVQTIVVGLKDQNGDGCIDLNEIRAAGSNSEIIEFSDMSQALHLYYNPLANLKICPNTGDLTGEQTIKDALNEFYATQKK